MLQGVPEPEPVLRAVVEAEPFQTRLPEGVRPLSSLGPQPWQLSFSYGRALQAPSLKAWKGDDANVQAGQDALAHRARMNGAARDGSYRAEMEKELAAV